MVVVETTSTETQESAPSETQPAAPQAEDNLHKDEEQHHRDIEMVSAQTQTQKRRGTDRVTQTPVVVRSHKETQTDLPVQEEKTQPDTNSAAETQRKHDEQTPEPMLQDDSAGQTQLRQNENPDSEGALSESAKQPNANLNQESKSEEAGPSAGVSGDTADCQPEKGAKPMSYAKAVCGDGSSEKPSNMAATKTHQHTR